MKYKDARILFGDLVACKYNDSLLIQYIEKDSLNERIISLKTEEIESLKNINKNSYEIIKNLEDVIISKDYEITKREEIIHKQKREIFKQKLIKKTALSTSIVLPILILIIFL